MFEFIVNRSFVGFLAGLLSFGAYAKYTYSTWQGKVKPNRSTWWSLTVIGLVIAFSYYAGGARDTMWVPLSYVVGPLVIAIMSVKYGEGNSWNMADRLCFFVSMASLVVWYYTGNAFVALIMSIIMDFFALLPTIKKSYLRPDTEDKKAWLWETISCALNVFAIESIAIEISLYPLYLVAINLFITVLLHRK